MNEPTDKSLHDWVHQTLHSYRPAYDPQDWKRVQRTLRRRRWWQRGAVFGIGLLVLFVANWFSGPNTPTPGAAKTASPASRPSIGGRVSPTSAQQKSDESVPITGTVHLPRRATTQRPEPTVTSPIWRDDIKPIITPYQPATLATNVAEQIRPMAVALSTEETAIQQQMLTGDFGSDSTSYQTLTRNLRQWPDAVVVCDLTSSMYPYSTQLFAWFRQNTRNSAVRGIVFFTDCDSLGQQTQPGGRVGRMFVTRKCDAATVLPLMIEAARNTVHNRDGAENDVEALLVAQKTFPEAKHLILLADNMSGVKDINRLDGVEKPVHVVLCGTTGTDLTQPFQTDHYNIARRTNGSLHTIEDDIDPGKITSQTTLLIGTHYYRYQARKKRFRLTSFTHRPIRLFGFLWL